MDLRKLQMDREIAGNMCDEYDLDPPNAPYLASPRACSGKNAFGDCIDPDYGKARCVLMGQHVTVYYFTTTRPHASRDFCSPRSYSTQGRGESRIHSRKCGLMSPVLLKASRD
jgi:hypothetical protein